MGATDHPGQNPPPLEGLALTAWSFYVRHATKQFVLEHKLMDSLINNLGLAGSGKELFVEMLGLIHQQRMGQPIEDGE